MTPTERPVQIQESEREVVGLGRCEECHKLGATLTVMCPQCGSPAFLHEGCRDAWLSEARSCLVDDEEDDVPESLPSPLGDLIKAYMLAKGFHESGPSGCWGHPHLGEGRRYWDCVQWQVGREMAGTDRVDW